MLTFRRLLCCVCVCFAGIGLLCPVSLAGLFDVSLGLDVYGSRDDNILSDE